MPAATMEITWSLVTASADAAGADAEVRVEATGLEVDAGTDAADSEGAFCSPRTL